MFFFFNDTATTEIYTLSLHDALPIYPRPAGADERRTRSRALKRPSLNRTDRKSTRLNSSHVRISYAVFCLKKKKNDQPGEAYDGKQLRAHGQILCNEGTLTTSLSETV